MQKIDDLRDDILPVLWQKGVFGRDFFEKCSLRFCQLTGADGDFFHQFIETFDVSSKIAKAFFVAYGAERALSARKAGENQMSDLFK